MIKSIKKRDGREVPYALEKIEAAIYKAMEAAGRHDKNASILIAKKVEEKLLELYKGESPGVEDIQDVVENVLMENGFAHVSKKYIVYRAERSKKREMNTNLMRIYNEITFSDAKYSDMKRDNANIDGDTAMGIMLKYGSEGAKDYYAKYVLTTEQMKAMTEGDIHIHDFDFYTLTTTCCQIDLTKLFHGGFSTGHGYLREPNDIQSYAALACIAIQSNQNDQHGGQSVPNFDYDMAKGVAKTYKKLYRKNFVKAMEFANPNEVLTEETLKGIYDEIEQNKGLKPSLETDPLFFRAEEEALTDLGFQTEAIQRVSRFATKTAAAETDRATFQAMEAFIHNLNTMHSRAGAQTPFSSINYGTDTSPEGKMAVKNVLLATEQGLGNGETPIFPIQIYKVKEGVNYNPEDPNYDTFKLSCRVSTKRLFPNFSFIDAPFNLALYEEGKPETEVAYMGCRTRVMANVYNKDNSITAGRGNLSFTSINLPRIAIKANGNVEWFFEELERKMALTTKQLLDRYDIQARKKVFNYPFLMGQGVWMDSEGLDWNDEVGEVLKNGTLSVGFIGLAECLKALTGKHHGESEEARNLGLDIIGFMRNYLDDLAGEKKMNFSLIATPAEGLAGRFVRMDAKKYGTISGVTDKEYYTNGFHVPVYYPMNAFDKIKVEAPYHNLTNAGHITYVELDGNAAHNLEAFEAVVRTMKESGVGYGSINHPIDSDPVCGYHGIIDDVCPKCGRKETDGPAFDRIRRITGYLVGTLDRFNDAKRAEERDRVKHHV